MSVRDDNPYMPFPCWWINHRRAWVSYMVSILLQFVYIMRLPSVRFSLLLLPLLVAALILGACDDSITDPGDDGPDPLPNPVEDSLEDIIGVWEQFDPDEPRFLIIEAEEFTEIFFENEAGCYTIAKSIVKSVDANVFTVEDESGDALEIRFSVSDDGDRISLTRLDTNTTFLFEPSDRERDSFTPVCED